VLEQLLGERVEGCPVSAQQGDGVALGGAQEPGNLGVDDPLGLFAVAAAGELLGS